MDLKVNQRIEEYTVRAVITRADGTVEDLGVIDSYRRSWVKDLINKLKGLFKNG